MGMLGGGGGLRVAACPCVVESRGTPREVRWLYCLGLLGGSREVSCCG